MKAMRTTLAACLGALLLCASGCGYHTLGSATHLPPDVKTLAVPEFATRTVHPGTERLMTQAVIREFAARTRMRITPDTAADADAVLKGTILQQAVTPLTYNTTTQQSSSYLVTVVAAVTLTDRDGKVLYSNDRYVFRQQYQSTTNLPTFLDESPAAEERLSRDFARALVADVLESF
ncbi:MAG: LPS assembly lipoprotein LptE [Acidobacteriota bacterium]